VMLYFHTHKKKLYWRNVGLPNPFDSAILKLSEGLV